MGARCGLGARSDDAAPTRSPGFVPLVLAAALTALARPDVRPASSPATASICARTMGSSGPTISGTSAKGNLRVPLPERHWEPSIAEETVELGDSHRTAPSAFARRGAASNRGRALCLLPSASVNSAKTVQPR